MHSQNFTNYCVLASFALCYIIILRFFYFIYICLTSMQRRRSRHYCENSKLQQLSNKELAGTIDKEKWLLQQQHEILQTKYNCLKELFHVYTANLHYRNTIQAIKRKQCLKKPMPELKNYSNCKSNFSSKVTDFENPKLSTLESRNGTNITYEKFKTEPYYDKSKKLRTVAIQTDDTNHALAITNKAGHNAFNSKGKSKLQNETETRLNSKISLIKKYIQKVLGQAKESEYPTRIRSRRHISFNFAMKSSHKNIGPNNCSDDNNPLIVSLVEVARKSCEADKSFRRCRFYGCGYVCYGIIEYNDHLNTHYPERKYICYFCHESFDKASHKFIHENKHLGVKFDLTSSKSDICCGKHIKRKPQDNFEESSVDFNVVINHESKDEIRNTRFKDMNASMTDSDLTLPPIVTTYKASQKRKQKCPHTNSSVYQSEEIELSECLSSKNLSKPSTKLPQKIRKISCRLCHKSYDSKCKLLYHINLKHADLYPSDTDITSYKEDTFITKPPNLGYKNSNYKSTESVCVSHVYKKPSKVGSIINRVKNGFHKYKWEPGTKIIRI